MEEDVCAKCYVVADVALQNVGKSSCVEGRARIVAYSSWFVWIWDSVGVVFVVGCAEFRLGGWRSACLPFKSGGQAASGSGGFGSVGRWRVGRRAERVRRKVDASGGFEVLRERVHWCPH